MRFWDSSALVALLSDADGQRAVSDHVGDGVPLVVWWGTSVEVLSAFARQERDGRLRPARLPQVVERLEKLAADWIEIEPSPAVRRLTQRLVRVHPLRAADAFQLAAALVAAEHDPGSVEFVCLDARLAAVASREGFRVVGGPGASHA
jgi:predicted nucleic acid-binding protein